MSLPLRFLADESCDFLVVKALRSAGFDVASVGEFSSGAQDQWVLEFALTDNRILITEDTDFGEWVFGRLHHSSGVLLIRFPTSARSSLAESILRLVADKGEKLSRSFTVVEPGRARIRKR
jgi:predicted nuclease of predicted toxin-antitoxin system